MAAVSPASSWQSKLAAKVLEPIKKSDPLSNKMLKERSLKELFQQMLDWGLWVFDASFKFKENILDPERIVDFHQKAWNAYVQQSTLHQIQILKQTHFRDEPALLHQLLSQQRLHQFRKSLDIESVGPMDSVQKKITLLQQWSNDPSLLHPYLYD